MKKKIALIVHRFGREVDGGAEFHSYQLANLLSKKYEVNILTTTALNYQSWENYYDEGKYYQNGLTIYRFRVERKRNLKKFNQYTDELLKRDPKNFEYYKWLKLQGPYSPTLLKFAKNNENNFDLFIIYTYLYYPGFYSIMSLKSRKIFIPTAHNEPVFYFPIYENIFKKIKSFIFLTEAEKDLVFKRFPFCKNSHFIIGGYGVKNILHISIEEERDLKSKFYINTPYILFLGRIEEGKGCKELIENFIYLKKEFPQELNLIFIGKRYMNLPKRNDIKYLGFLSEREKWIALKNAIAVVVPSRFESLSIVALESLSMGTPILVNGECEVLKTLVSKSQGGLIYMNKEEFTEAIEILLENKGIRNELSKNATSFINKFYRWDVWKKRIYQFVEDQFKYQKIK